MNAISRPDIETDDRVARQMRMCRDLAELGMALAQAAAKKALTDFAALAEPGDKQAKPDGTTTDYTQLFIRLSSNVRQIMLLEARLDAGVAPPRPARVPSPRAPRPTPGAPSSARRWISPSATDRTAPPYAAPRGTCLTRSSPPTQRPTYAPSPSSIPSSAPCASTSASPKCPAISAMPSPANARRCRTGARRDGGWAAWQPTLR